MSETKPWRKLWRDVNRDTAFLALSVRAQCVFLRLIPEMPDDGKLRAAHGSTAVERVALLLSMSRKPTANAIREIVQRGLAAIDEEGSLSLTAFEKRQGSTTPSAPRSRSSNADRQRAYRARRNSQRNASDGVTVTESNGVTPVTRNGEVTESNVTSNGNAVTRSDSENVLSTLVSSSGESSELREKNTESAHATVHESKPKRQRTDSQPASSSTEVQQVFAHWVRETGRTSAAKLDAKRRARVEWALATYGLDACLETVSAYARSDFHSGKNDRGQTYNDLTLIFRDAQHAEAFSGERAAARPNPRYNTGALERAKAERRAAGGVSLASLAFAPEAAHG